MEHGDNMFPPKLLPDHMRNKQEDFEIQVVGYTV
jgi:hypothetical protein